MLFLKTYTGVTPSRGQLFLTYELNPDVGGQIYSAVPPVVSTLNQSQKWFFFGIIADYSFYGNSNTQYNDWKTLNFSLRPLHYCLGCFFCYERSWSHWLSLMSKVSENIYLVLHVSISPFTKFTQDLQNILKKESWLLESAHGNNEQKLISQRTVPIILQN